LRTSLNNKPSDRIIFFFLDASHLLAMPFAKERKENAESRNLVVYRFVFAAGARRTKRRSDACRWRVRDTRYSVWRIFLSAQRQQRFNGWGGQGTFNFNRYLGVTADVSGSILSPFSFSTSGFSASTYQHVTNYLFGPTVTAGFGRSAVFAHALFGAAHSSLGAGVNIPIIGGISTGLTSANAFAMAFGGGIDIGMTRHFAIRAVQVDYIRTQFNSIDALTSGLSSSLGNRQNSFRYSSGIVFRF